MRILRLQICKTGSQQENLLSVTIFMVFISFAEISAPSSASLFANGKSVSIPGPESTASKRPWPSHEFLRSVIDGVVKPTSPAETTPTKSITPDYLESRTISSNEETNTKRSLQTSRAAIGFPLRISSTTLGRRKENDSNEPVKYVKISGRRDSLENTRNHWQTLNKTGIIVAQNRNQVPGFGWYSGGQDLYLPVGFSKLPGTYPQVTTQYPGLLNPSYYENYGTTGRPILQPSTSYTKWYAPVQPEVSKRPSVIIVKDKVSANHWGSSGSTLPPQDFHYSGGNYVSSTPNPVLDSLVSPYKQYGSESIFGNNAFTQAPSSVWFKPTLNQYTTTVSPVVLTAKPEHSIIDNGITHSHNKNIMFKIWSYLEDGKLKLHGEKEIPAYILNGHTIKDGDILNIDHVPAPIRQLVSTSLSPSPGTITVNNGNTEWQKIPILIPGGPSVGWGEPPIKERPVSLNYVIWGSSTTPAPPTQATTLLPTPDDYRKYLQEYLIRMTTPAPPKQDTSIDTWIVLQNYFQSQMATQIPITQGQDPLRVGDMNNMANMVMLQTILSHLNKQANRDRPDNPKKQSDITRLTPPSRDSFWSSLYPIYQHLLTKKFKFPSIIRDDQTMPLGGFPDEPQSDPLSLSQFGNSYGQSQNPDFGNSYGQEQNSDNPISITESYLNSAESFHKTLIPKTGKSGRRGRKKKCKKYKKYGHHGYGWGLLPNIINPDKFDFNYKFGIDFFDILKKKFYALLAVGSIPIIVLSIFTVLPFAFLIWPELLKMFKKGLNHYNPFHHNHHKHHPHHQIQHHQQPQFQYPHQYPYQDFEQQQNYNPYQQSGYYQDQQYLGDNTGHFANKRDPAVPVLSSFQSQYPASGIATLVESTFGNRHSVVNVSEPWRGKIMGSTGVPYTYVDYNLKVTTTMPYTAYNRKVMETLMNIRNRDTSPTYPPKGQTNYLGRSISSNSSHGEGIGNNTIVGQGKGKKRVKHRVVQIPSPVTIIM